MTALLLIVAMGSVSCATGPSRSEETERARQLQDQLIEAQTQLQTDREAHEVVVSSLETSLDAARRELDRTLGAMATLRGELEQRAGRTEELSAELALARKELTQANIRALEYEKRAYDEAQRNKTLEMRVASLEAKLAVLNGAAAGQPTSPSDGADSDDGDPSDAADPVTLQGQGAAGVDPVSEDVVSEDAAEDARPISNDQGRDEDATPASEAEQPTPEVGGSSGDPAEPSVDD